MRKKVLAFLTAAAMLLVLAACGPQSDDENPNEGGEGGEEGGDGTYVVGICQQVQHEALDAATQGFQDALKEELGDAVTFLNQNASNDQNTCATICTGFVAEDVDLILANGTTALQAATSATQTIPVLGTSITEYGVALDLDDFSGTVGGNVSGTSDLAPLDQQAQMLMELLPEAQTVGILYCSGEPNSVYQAEVVEQYLTDAGLTVNVYTFADSNDVATVTASACSENDALYIPTDNTAASCTEAINNVAEPAGVPIIAGEAGICKGCGIATLSIDYYELGVTTGKMAAKILKGEANIEEMAIEYYQNPVKQYMASRCETLNITVPEGYTAIEE